MSNLSSSRARYEMSEDDLTLPDPDSPAFGGIDPGDSGELPRISDRWELVERLGSGGAGQVYLAKHMLLDKLAAVKLLNATLTANDTSVKRFQQEAMATSKLKHQNIVEVHDCGIADDGRCFLIMEYVDGESLAEARGPTGKFDPEWILPVVIQICAGLNHAHKRGIIHRDIKPKNIMLLDDEFGKAQVKIVDFGLAKLLPDSSMSDEQRLTRTGEVFGSPLYMSPEQCDGVSKIDGRTDVYAIGCLLYESLHGRAPFIGHSVLDTFRRHLRETPKPLCDDSAPPVMQRLNEIVLKSLEKNPEDRYQTVEELMQELFDCIESEAERSRLSESIPELADKRRIKSSSSGVPAVTIAISLAGIVLAAVLIFLLVRGQSVKPVVSEDYTNRPLWRPQVEKVDPPADYLRIASDLEQTERMASRNAKRSRSDFHGYLRALLSLGDNYLRYGDTASAVNMFKKYFKVNATYPEWSLPEDSVDLAQVKVKLAQAYYRQNRLLEAEEILEPVMSQLAVMDLGEIPRTNSDMLETFESVESLLAERAKKKKGMIHFRKAITAARKLQELKRDQRVEVARWQAEEADLERRLSSLYSTTGSTRGKYLRRAASGFGKSLKIWQDDPNAAKSDVLKAESGLFLTLLLEGKTADALAQIEPVAGELESRIKDAPGLASYVQEKRSEALWKVEPLKALSLSVSGR